VLEDFDGSLMGLNPGDSGSNFGSESGLSDSELID
jgi:hypothetical protein